MLGLWRGLGPNVARNAIVNAAELASFDQVRHQHFVVLGKGKARLLFVFRLLSVTPLATGADQADAAEDGNV